MNITGAVKQSHISIYTLLPFLSTHPRSREFGYNESTRDLSVLNVLILILVDILQIFPFLRNWPECFSVLPGVYSKGLFKQKNCNCLFRIPKRQVHRCDGEKKNDFGRSKTAQLKKLRIVGTNQKYLTSAKMGLWMRPGYVWKRTVAEGGKHATRPYKESDFKVHSMCLNYKIR